MSEVLNQLSARPAKTSGHSEAGVGSAPNHVMELLARSPNRADPADPTEYRDTAERQKPAPEHDGGLLHSVIQGIRDWGGAEKTRQPSPEEIDEEKERNAQQCPRATCELGVGGQTFIKG